MDFITNIWGFIVAHWATIAVVALVLKNIIVGTRDALDATPETDDNIIEKAASITLKVLGYLIGFRPGPISNLKIGK